VLRMHVAGVNFQFCCCHLAAGQTKVAERNFDFTTIAKKLSTVGSDATFFFGDLNYRINLQRDECIKHSDGVCTLPFGLVLHRWSRSPSSIHTPPGFACEGSGRHGCCLLEGGRQHDPQRGVRGGAAHLRFAPTARHYATKRCAHTQIQSEGSITWTTSSGMINWFAFVIFPISFCSKGIAAILHLYCIP
jgi:hypothetical protein